MMNAVPHGFPALMRAKKVQKKAAHVGFDWPDPIDLASQTDLMLQDYLITLAANKNASFELEPISPLEGSLI